MPRFMFAMTTSDDHREAGIVQSDSFDNALEAIAEQASPKVGDTLEIGVTGFPPARYECVSLPFAVRPSWVPAGRLAA